jgi:large subunit ribosomal protein L23
MSILKSVKNLINQDKGAEKIAAKHKEAAREAREEKKKEEGKSEKKVSYKEDKGSIGLYIIHGPHFTEKASFMGEDNKYVFRVFSTANKITIKSAIEKIYDVKVADVNVVNIHAKKKIVRGREGKKQGYKKAIVTLKEGYKIEA